MEVYAYMSLRFIFGGSGAGKSTLLYAEIIERAEKEPERNFAGPVYHADTEGAGDTSG